MNNTKTETTSSWQFRLEDFSNNTCKGVRLIAARKGIHGRWLAPDKLPAYVRDYFLPEARAGVTFVADYADIAALLAALGASEGTNPAEGEEGRIVWGKATPGAIQGVITLRPQDISVPVGNLPELPGFRSGDGAKWGISDFYEDKEEALRGALAAGTDFTTGWFASKKEIASGKVSRCGKIVLCEASVSDDFDCEGHGSVEVPVGRKGVDRLFEAIVEALDQAYGQAGEDQKDNSQVRLWAVRNAKAWVETYLENTGDGCFERPPGDNYHAWGWQNDGGKVPKKVKLAFEDWLGTTNDDTFTSGKWTIDCKNQ